MDGSGTPPNQQINLQTLVATIQGAVNAQNLIATNVAKLTAATTALTTATTTASANLVSAFNTAFPPPLTGSASWTPGGVTSGSEVSTTVTVASAVLGDVVSVSFSLDLTPLVISAYISAANTVTVVLANNSISTVTVGAGIVKVSVRTS